MAESKNHRLKLVRLFPKLRRKKKRPRLAKPTIKKAKNAL